MERRKLQNTMYAALPNLIIGFHGCDSKTYQDVLNNRNKLNPSVNSYDWLGNGIYFWEQNLERAWEWAKNNPKVEKPAVLGAVIDLGYCLNLLDSNFIKLVKNEYHVLRIESSMRHIDLPINRNVGSNNDLLLRNLDCAVIEHLHQTRKIGEEPEFDSVRGMFFEGEEIYPNSGFREKSHIQICIRNPNCIKGFFSPLEIDKNWKIP